MIAELVDCAQSMLLSPEQPKNPALVVEALQGVLAAYVGLVKVHNASSSLEFALRDLPHGEREHYQQANHALGVLARLNPPPF
jgi:hypothetical protein